MRILQVLLDPRIGGAEAVAETLGSQWSQAGHETKIVYLDPVPFCRTGRTNRYFRLRRAIKEYGPHVVLAHTELPSIYARLCAPLSVPIVTVLHSGNNYIVTRTQKLVERLLLLRTSSIIAVGDAQRAAYIESTGWGGAIHVIPNPIRSDIAFREVIPAGGRRVIIGNVARIVDSKDPFFWHDVAEESLSSGLEAEFSWWGPLGDSVSCAALVSEVRAKNNSNIRFAGPTDDVPSVLAQIDVFFSPSKWEAFSISLHEAILAGVPVVCTTGVGATIDPRAKRFEYESGDVRGAIAAIKLALRAGRGELESGAALVAAEFSPHVISRRYLDVLMRVSSQ